MAAIDAANEVRVSHSAWQPGRIWSVAGGSLVAATLIWSSAAASQVPDPQSKTLPIDALHRALHLSPGQEDGWRAYRTATTAPSQAQDRRRAASQMFPQLSAPQRMDLVEAEMRQELGDLQQQSQALKTFYMTLSAKQRTAFDAQTLPPQSSPQQDQ